jgi:hypothetical protein
VREGCPGWLSSPGGSGRWASSVLVLEKLLRDPLLRDNIKVSGFWSLLRLNSMAREGSGVVATMPAHCVALVVQTGALVRTDVAGFSAGNWTNVRG